MRPHPSFIRLLAASTAVIVVTGSPLLAANLFWDGGNANIPTDGDGVSDGGAGTWNTTLLNWDGGASPHVAWVNANNDTAIFAGTGGAIALTTITANGLDFTTTGYSITGSTLTLAGTTPTITTGTSVSATIGSILSGSAGLTKAGDGTLILTGSNNFTGATAVNEGILTLGVGGTLANTSSITIASGATLSVANTAAHNSLVGTTQTGTLNINGTLVSNATNAAQTMYFSSMNMTNGTLASTNPNISGFGAFLINGIKTINASGTNTISGTGVIGISAGNTLTLNTALIGDTVNVTGTIGQGASGTAGSLNKTGLGSVVLTGANTYTGTTAVSGGTLQLNTGGSITNANNLVVGNGVAAGTLTIAGGTYTTTAPGPFGLTVGNGSNGTFNISSGSVTTTGIVTGNTAHTAQWTQTGGTVTLNTASGFFAGNIAGGTSQFDISGGNVNSLTSLIYLGMRANTTLNLSNSGVATFASLNSGFAAATNNVINLGDGTNFSGGANIAAGGTSGVLALGSLATTSGTLAVNFKGGTLKARGASATFLGATSVSVQDAGGIIDNTTFAITISPVLAHGGVAAIDGGMIFKGSGTTTLTGANTYTGATSVTAGALLVNGSIASSAVTVDSPGTLGGGTNVTSGTTGAVTVNSGGIINPGAVGAIGTLNTGATSISGTYICDLNASTSDLIASSGALTLTSATLTFNALATPTAPSYTIATYTGATPAFTTVNSLPSGYQLDYTTNGQINLVQAGSGGYANWALDNDLTEANNGVTEDPDNDGIRNLLEYVLNGDPLASSQTILPVLDASGSNFVFTFNRRNESKDDTTQIFQYGPNLVDWTDVPIPPSTSGIVTITPDTPTTGIDKVMVTVAKGVNPSLFGRLYVTKP